MTFVYISRKTLDWSKRIQMTFLKSIFHPEVSCSAHLYIISPRSSQKIVSREPRYFRALGGFAHTTFAHRKIFWGVRFLKLQFQNAVMASKMVPWALKPRNIEPRKIWAQSDNQKTFKTHFEVYFSCLFTLLLVNSNQKSK